MLYMQLEAAHLNQRTIGKGLGSKAPDAGQLVLCVDCHRGTKGLDMTGNDAFSKLHRINLYEIALANLTRFISETAT